MPLLHDLLLFPPRVVALETFVSETTRLLKANLLSISFDGSILREDFVVGRSDINTLIITRTPTIEHR